MVGPLSSESGPTAVCRRATLAARHAHHQAGDEQDEKDEEQEVGDTCRRRRDSAESKHRGDGSTHKEY